MGEGGHPCACTRKADTPAGRYRSLEAQKGKTEGGPEERSAQPAWKPEPREAEARPHPKPTPSRLEPAPVTELLVPMGAGNRETGGGERGTGHTGNEALREPRQQPRRAKGWRGPGLCLASTACVSMRQGAAPTPTARLSPPRPPPPWCLSQGPAPGEPRGAGHLLDVFGALVVDEDDDGVDVHVVQPLDGVRADVQETVPVLKGARDQSGPGGGPRDAGALPPVGPPLPHCSTSLHQ